MTFASLAMVIGILSKKAYPNAGMDNLYEVTTEILVRTIAHNHVKENLKGREPGYIAEAFNNIRQWKANKRVEKVAYVY